MLSTIFASGAWVSIVDAVIVLLLAIAAVTPTDKDDSIAARVKNLWDRVRGAFARGPQS